MGNIKFPIRRPMVSNINQPIVASAAAAAGDPFWNNVVFLSHFDGPQDSTSFTDESNSAHVITSNVVCKLDQTFKVFGSASLLVDTNGYASTPDSDDFHIGTQEVTIEGRFRWSEAGSGFQCLLGKWSSSNKEWAIFYDTAGDELIVFVSVNGFTSLQRAPSSFTPTVGTFYAIRADRDATNKWRIYVDGPMIGSEIAADDVRNGTLDLGIGADSTGGSGFPGHADEVRITMGVARTGSDAGYTIATEAFPDS